jgi:predicted nucleic acid-binding protein
MIYLADTNVFSKIFKDDVQLKLLVESQDVVICATVYIENLQGSKSNKEKHAIKKYLDNFPRILTNELISSLAIELIETYSNSHGLLLADAQIAATALEHNLTILTYNIADFHFIKNLKWQNPPF